MTNVAQKNTILTSFMAAFAGMVVAIPVAVTVSVMVVKASFADNQQLAHQVSQLSAQVNDPTFMPIHSVSTTHQHGGDVAVAAGAACVGDAQPVTAVAAPAVWTGTGVKAAYKPYGWGSVSHSFNTTVHNTTNNTSWAYTDSYNTVGSHNHSTTVNHNQNQTTTNIASNNTVTGNTLNVDSNNNSNNTTTTTTTTAVNTAVTTNSNNTNSGNATIASGNTVTSNSNNTVNSNNSVLSDNNVNVDSNNTQVGAFQNI